MWITRDPLGYVSGQALGEYVGSHPLKTWDPLGLQQQVPDIPVVDRLPPKIFNPGDPAPLPDPDPWPWYIPAGTGCVLVLIGGIWYLANPPSVGVGAEFPYRPHPKPVWPLPTPSPVYPPLPTPSPIVCNGKEYYTIPIAPGYLYPPVQWPNRACRTSLDEAKCFCCDFLAGPQFNADELTNCDWKPIKTCLPPISWCCDPSKRKSLTEGGCASAEDMLPIIQKKIDEWMTS